MYITYLAGYEHIYIYMGIITYHGLHTHDRYIKDDFLACYVYSSIHNMDGILWVKKVSRQFTLLFFWGFFF